MGMITVWGDTVVTLEHWLWISWRRLWFLLSCPAKRGTVNSWSSRLILARPVPQIGTVSDKVLPLLECVRVPRIV
jgi:hypothetical protein